MAGLDGITTTTGTGATTSTTGVDSTTTSTSQDSESRFEVENDATEGVGNLSGEDLTKVRSFLAAANTATGGDEEISTFLEKGAHLKFVEDDELTEGVMSEFDPETGDVLMPVSMAKEALETLDKLPEDAIGEDGSVDPDVLATNKDLLTGVNELNTLVAHEFEHLEDADTGQDDNALRLAELVASGDWDLDSDTGGADRQLVDAVVTTFKLNRGLFKELEGVEATEDGHKNGNNVGTAAMTSVIREYDAHLAEEQRLTKLADQGLIAPDSFERLVTDESGEALDYQTAVSNLLELALKPSDENALGAGGGGLIQDDASDARRASRDSDSSDGDGVGDSQLTTAANYDPNFKDPRRRNGH